MFGITMFNMLTIKNSQFFTMQLTAGKLTMHYENGFLRWITAGEYEVLRMIYFAVRDKVWGTVPSKIINEKIEQYENSFTVSYEMLFEQDDIKIQWNATIGRQH